jgi:ComF family protein
MAMAMTLDADIARVLFPVPAADQPRWRRVLHVAVDAALDVVFPPHCSSCGEPLPANTNKALCLPCAEAILWIGASRCMKCGDAVGRGAGAVDDCPSCRSHPPAFVHSACTVAAYGGPVRDLVLALKFGRRAHLARVLGELLAQRVRATQLAEPGMIVVPAPMTPRAMFHRGFNQAAEIASIAARLLNLQIEARLLRKIRPTPPQATLTAEARQTNLKDAFACVPRVAQRHQGRRVLLVDDVITTGATVSECARTLAGAGIREVRAAAFARG